jgi:hypothetical protein
MKYSLRSLMIVVTLVAVVAAFVGRASYLERQAVAHEREYEAIFEKICPPEDIKGTNTRQYMKIMKHHRLLADAYRKSIWRPWLVVRETPAPSLPKPFPKT